MQGTVFRVEFFVPLAPEDQQEQRYAVLSAWAGARTEPVPPPSERIRSIVFTHDRQPWTATVGQRLCRESGLAADATDVRPYSDAVTVLVIVEVAGTFRLVTDQEPIGRSVPSRWKNPQALDTAHVLRVERFSG